MNSGRDAGDCAADAPVDVEVCVVGGGPHGLAVVAHLVAAKPSLRERIVVVDPSGRWLRAWHEQFARLEIGVLRSPIVHHPDVHPAALARFVDDGDLARSKLPYDPPLTPVFASFCSDVIERFGLGDLVVEGRVTGLVAGDPMVVTTPRATIRARHVVWTGNTAARIVPGPFAPLSAGESVQHAADVDLRAIGSLVGEHVIVVGGGLTAGHLAVGAVQRRARVTLVTRRPIVERDFDVEPGWLGPRYLNGFWRHEDPRRRLDIARAARGGGSMPGWMCRRLRAEIDGGRIEHIVGPVEACRFDDGVGEVHVAGRSLAADRCWLATGTRPDVHVDAALAGLVEQHIDGFPVVDRHLRVGSAPLHVMGRLAMMEIGPAAGNLWGARTAARRITWALMGIDLDTDAVAEVRPRASAGAER